MRYLILALALLLGPAMLAQAQVQTSISVGVVRHGVSIGFTMSNYPSLVRIPGYPVYYDPYADFNYFYYDGLYWVYLDDGWYASAWYNGPWDLISPYAVPLFILRIPVRYYRRPPPYFQGWRVDAAPRWGEHWGREWERQRGNWDHWDRRAVPAAAPLPSYQRFYNGSGYPRTMERQRQIESSQYRYQPRDRVSRQLLEQRRDMAPPRQQRYPSSPSRTQQPQPYQQRAPQPYAPQPRQRTQPAPGQRNGDHRNPKGRSGQNRDKDRRDQGGGHPG